MWKKILFVTLLAGVAAAVVVIRKRVQKAPESYQVERGTFIAASPATIIAEISRLQNWVAWSRDKDDPAIHRTYGGPKTGTGASYYWFTTDGSVQGRMTVISVAPDSVELEREMVSPNPRLTDYTFKVTPEGSGSRLVWSATGDVDEDFIGRALGSTKEHEQRVASDLESALAGLKKVVEAQEDMQAWRVERSATIAAPAVFVLEEIMDFREWSKWLPREKLDPKLKRVFSGTDAKPGTTYYWAGNDRVGAGRMSMISSTAEKVELEVELDKPLESLSDLVFTLAPEGAGTRVTWTISGDKDASGDAYTLLGTTPATVGAEMEAGLAAMKKLVETSVPLAGGKEQVALAAAKAAAKVSRIVIEPIVTRRRIRRIVLDPIVMRASR